MIILYCSSCSQELDRSSKYCPNCGKSRKKSKILPFLLVLSLFTTTGFAYSLYYYFEKTSVSPTTKIETVKEPKKEIVKQLKEPAPVKTEVVKKKTPATPLNLPKLIAEAQNSVFTIFTETSQGSGFLISDKGDILTNAHVVEGNVDGIVKDKQGNQLFGQVIGYSNEVDIAIVRVPELAGKKPLALETSTPAMVGQEVIALGTPQGLENTATMGYVTGTDRSFFIGERSYDHIYQMSAQIAPGSSGGPLLSKDTGKAIAVNSAKMVNEDSVGFSIPIKDIYSLVNDWMNAPMSIDAIQDLFYNENGDYYYEDLWENENEWYFDGGDFSEDEEYNSSEEYGGDLTYEEENEIDENTDSNYDEEYTEEEQDDTNEYSDEENNDYSDEYSDGIDEEVDDNEYDNSIEEDDSDLVEEEDSDVESVDEEDSDLEGLDEENQTSDDY